ncbi:MULTISPECIES: Trk system potassium transporter TrkA [Streptococcus]|uniref:Trk system potassium uptake protein TrkA n=2 Tax=Streptococcus equinus TaxID=1335 RepID=E8JPZ4_STREI|nr:MULTISPECIES: Trk system potassium transporter TrkA [Streptococcus]EFW88722.1 potassium transporter peripheral membrane component [Streptococcus equinus ATCC 9812]MCQ2963478.1 Trk system potassium transporter TrkA [Streptococcus sp.]TFH45619.1 Trk system potassium transporter TrkA [Streptococcus equinus]SDL54661.1 trk system potassium uptake protein TrkA [Streptococcus equinus]SUN57527.1 potassium transporter peripheral membrane protein [Streptococcus equinus]
MKIIVVGGGKVGTALCRSLVEEKHDVVLIEEKEAVLKNITKRHDIMGIVGNGANFKILEQADVANCDIFIALTDKDEVNMISAVLAKQMGAKETVVRVRNPEYSNSYFKDKNFLGFSLVVNPELLTARYIANSVDFPNALSVEHFVNGRVMLMEFMISDGSKLCHMSLSQFRKKFGNLVICAIERRGKLIIPDGDATLQTGDKIFVTGNRIDMILFHNSMKPKYIKNMMIIGAGRIAYYLLNILKNTKINLKIIENNPEQAEMFSQEFPNVHVVQGDGTAKSVLLEECVENFDAVATLTGVDEENIITSMFLETLGVPKNITKVNRTSLLEIIDPSQFSSIITPKSIAVDSMMHFIRGRVNAQDSNLDAMHHVANGRIETLQFEIRENNKMAGKSLSSLKFKENILIAAIIRNGRTIYPTGEDVFEVGDKIVVVTFLKNITRIYDLLAR